MHNNEILLMKQAVELADKIVSRYGKYNVPIDIKMKKVSIMQDRFKFQVKLLPGGKISDLKKYAREIQTNLKLPVFRVVEEGIVLYIVASKEPLQNFDWYRLLVNPAYAKLVKDFQVAHPIGKDALGKIVIEDMALYPHVLIAGTTGSGKSSAAKMLLLDLLLQYPPGKVNLLIGDLADELLEFNGVPHLSYPVIQDCKKFFCAMLRLRDEMERRVKLKGSEEYFKLPRIICVVDEFSSFIAGSDVESKQTREIITELLRRGRHAKIHLVLITHNPTQKSLKLDVSDIPTKMVFRVARTSDSVAILGKGGAEKLAGNGEMLFQSSQSGDIQQIQGAYIPDVRMKKLLYEARRRWWYSSTELKFVISEEDMQNTDFEAINVSPGKSMIARQKQDDKLFAEVAFWVLSQDDISANILCERFHIGWRRASSYISRLQNLGMVAELDAKLPRKVTVDAVESLSTELIELFCENGYTEDDLISACHKDK